MLFAEERLNRLNDLVQALMKPPSELEGPEGGSMSYVGGGGGSRTRVREHVGKCIYVRSLRMNFRPFRPPQAGSRSG